MSPAEFFFLAVGLVLGVAAGAAILDVVRARPPRPEVRLTITRDALPRRTGTDDRQPKPGDPIAANPAGTTDAGQGSPGGPSAMDGDPSSKPEPSWPPDLEPATASPLLLRGRPAPIPPLTARPTSSLLAPKAAAPSMEPDRTAGRIPLAVGKGVDPTLAALRAVARERVPVAAGETPPSRIRRPFEKRAGAESAGGGAPMRPTAAGRGRSSGGDSSGGDSDTTAGAGNGNDASGSTRGSAGSSGSAASNKRAASHRSAASSASGAPDDSRTSHGPVPNGSSPSDPPATPDETGGGTSASDQTVGVAATATNGASSISGPCAEERLLAEERCTVAAQARERAEEVAAELRRVQRVYDQASAQAEAAGKASDPRAVADAKEAARQKFRTATHAARARADLEAAATEWLEEINRVNRERREASEVADEARQTAAALLRDIERLTLAADASRITAEAATSACMEARQLVADCEEAARAPQPVETGPAPAPAAPSRASTLLEALSTPTELEDVPDAEVAALAPAPSYRDGEREPAVFRLLQGDRQTLLGLVDSLSAGDRDERQHVQGLLSELVDAVISGAIEACVLDFPTEGSFWADFNRNQCRDIAVALASLGYRFDGMGGFADDRVPSQRDLSLAVGFAGLDPMRIRRWPDEAEMQALMREVRVAADEFLAARAPDLTLGEMVTLLGRRSEALADLWNAWGRARPLLLAATA